MVKCSLYARFERMDEITVQPTAVPGQTGCPIEIRPMIFEDVDFVGRMTIEAFQSKFVHAVGKDKIEDLIKGSQKAHTLMQSEYYRIFVALYNGERAGVIQLQFHDSKDPGGVDDAFVEYLDCWSSIRLMCLGCLIDNTCKRNECYIDHICCESKFRGKGIGKVLMERAELASMNRGCKVMTLYVATSNRARNLYERQGYEVKKEEDGCCCAYCVMGIRKFYKMEKRLQ